MTCFSNYFVKFILHPGHSFQKFLCSWGFANSAFFSDAFLLCFRAYDTCLWIWWSLEGFSLGEIEGTQIKRILSVVNLTSNCQWLLNRKKTKNINISHQEHWQSSYLPHSFQGWLQIIFTFSYFVILIFNIFHSACS